MLLRRVIDHVKTQNWTAVGLDFLIVVLGVFFGLQVNNWNDARHNERRKDYAMNALQTEFEQNIRRLQQVQTYLGGRSEQERGMVLALAEDNPAGKAALINDAFTQIMYFSYLGVQDSAFESLKQSGDMALIDDQKTLMAVNEYYRLLIWTQEQRNNFRDGMNRLAPEWRGYVFHSPTQSPAVTDVRVDIDALLDDPRALSAVAEVVRMRSIFLTYIPPIVDRATKVCEMLAAETGRPCQDAGN